MSTSALDRSSLKRPLRPRTGLLGTALRLAALGIIDAFAARLLAQLVVDGVWFLAAVIGIIAVGANVIFLRERLFPLRWLSPGLVLMVLVVLYPLAYTVYVAFTNYSNLHLLTKRQAVEALEQELFMPEGASTYRWTAFRSSQGEYALWLVSEDGQAQLVRPGQLARPVVPEESGVGPLDRNGVPQSIQGYQRLSRAEAVRSISELAGIQFGRAPDTFRISSADKAGRLQQKYVYDSRQDAMVDQETGEVYRAAQGAFKSDDGRALSPSFQAPVGLRNFRRLFEGPTFRGPILEIFVWTVVFATLAVLVQFAIGLFLAVVFNDADLPRPIAKLIRAILLLPFVIPSYLSILVWRGMFNPHVGIISRAVRSLIGWSPTWLLDTVWAKIAVLVVAFWLGYPYFMLVATGALQAISSEILEAAEVDGASAWQRFWAITLPILLVSVAPLLVLSFAHNFNNFNAVYLLTRGDPPMAGTTVPAGHTDLLITFTYRLAFEGGRGADYGLASAITMVIYLVLAPIVYSQLQFSRTLEEEA